MVSLARIPERDVKNCHINPCCRFNLTDTMRDFGRRAAPRSPAHCQCVGSEAPAPRLACNTLSLANLSRTLFGKAPTGGSLENCRRKALPFSGARQLSRMLGDPIEACAIRDRSLPARVRRPHGPVERESEVLEGRSLGRSMMIGFKFLLEEKRGHVSAPHAET